MHGNNPKRKAILGDGSSLEIKDIFKTIQGEGPKVGTPAIFIRLGGCNLSCDFCDTEFENFQKKSLTEILEKTNSLAEDKIKLVVITGGEPLRQPIENLCKELLQKNYQIQIETNGTLYRDLDERVEIICSPKNESGRSYKKVRNDLIKKISAYKIIISANNTNYDHIPIFILEQKKPVFLQPMDEENENINLANIELTKELCLKYNFRFSLQAHKIIGVK